MDKWILRKLDDLPTEIIGGALFMLIVTVVPIVWAYLGDLPGPMILAVGLVTFGGTLLIVNQGPTVWRKIRERRLPEASGVQLAQPYLRGLTIRITDLAIEGVVTGRTFEDCDLWGPAILVPIGQMDVFHESVFDGDYSATLWEIAKGRNRLVGVIGVKDCTFRRCRLHRIGLAGDAATIRSMKKGIRESTADERDDTSQST